MKITTSSFIAFWGANLSLSGISCLIGSAANVFVTQFSQSSDAILRSVASKNPVCSIAFFANVAENAQYVLHHVFPAISANLMRVLLYLFFS